MAKKRPQPGKNKTIRTQRRREIAKKLVEQKTPAEIGKEIGLSRQMVNVEIRAAETQRFIQDAMAPYLDDIREMIPGAIAAVRDSLRAPLDALALAAKNGQEPESVLKSLNAPIDRIRGVRALGWLMQWAQGKPNEGEQRDAGRFNGTMEELLILYKQTVNGEPGGPL